MGGCAAARRRQADECRPGDSVTAAEFGHVSQRHVRDASGCLRQSSLAAHNRAAHGRAAVGPSLACLAAVMLAR